MNRTGKLILGFFTFLPLALMIVYFVLMANMFSTVLSFDPEHLPESNPGLVFAQFGPLMIVALLLALSALGLMIVYIVHVVRNEAIENTERLVWVVLFVFAGIIGMPIYWYLRIWEKPKWGQGIDEDARLV